MVVKNFSILLRRLFRNQYFIIRSDQIDHDIRLESSPDPRLDGGHVLLSEDSRFCVHIELKRPDLRLVVNLDLPGFHAFPYRPSRISTRTLPRVPEGGLEPTAEDRVGATSIV